MLTVFMAMGAWRISQARVLTRRAAAIETLGSATVLCTDKTGTLTQNRMTIAELRLMSGAVVRVRTTPAAACPEPFHDLARVRRPARSARRTVRSDGQGVPRPRGAASAGIEHAMPTGRCRCTPTGCGRICSRCRTSGSAGRRRSYVVAAKGAPEAIAELCHLRRRRSAPRWRDSVDAMAADGPARARRGPRPPSRRRRLAGHRSTTSRSSFSAWSASPIRCGRRCRRRSRECRTAGIRVVMITGDYPATAQAIARQAGLDVRRLRHRRRTRAARRRRTGAAAAQRYRVRAHHAGAEAAHRRRR